METHAIREAPPPTSDPALARAYPLLAQIAQRAMQVEQAQLQASSEQPKAETMQAMPFDPLEPVIEALNEHETQDRAQYAKRLRATPTFDVASEMVYLQGKLECYGLESLQEQPDETLPFIGALVKDARWKRDLCLAEIEHRRKRNLLPMSGAIGLAPDVIERLKTCVDIKSVVEYAGVELEKRGQQWWGLCPWHADKTPSFAVNTDKGLFFCYSCRVGGDVITFLQKMNDESFMSTIRRLAALANEELPGIAA